MTLEFSLSCRYVLSKLSKIKLNIYAQYGLRYHHFIISLLIIRDHNNIHKLVYFITMGLTYLIFILFIILLIIYCYLKRLHSHWENQNVPSLLNPNTILGHMLPVITLQENIAEFVGKAYKNFNSSVVGFYFMRKPGIIVRDPDLVKSVLQTNFSSFHNNFIKISDKNDPILIKNPFFTSDFNLWRERRNRISNNLSSKKIKYLFVISQEVCNKMIAFVDRKIQENGEFYECELKQYFTRCTGEIVANAAFSIEGQSFEDNPDPLSFTNIAKTLLEPTLINGIKQSIIFFFPSVANFLGVAFLAKKSDKYMRQNIKKILEKRQKTGKTPNDYLQFSLECSSDLDDILADVVNFYGDVYETSSSAMANLFYLLSQNPEIQLNLRDHITAVLRENNGQVTYESLKNMTYLDQVIHESLRMIPPFGVQMKYCTEEITLKGSDGITCHMKPGNVVFIPGICLQQDERYWHNPEVFDPERFSPVNQKRYNKYTFLPFGEGPRMCVGMRFGLMLVKQSAASLITKFSIEHSPMTKMPLKIDPNSIMTGYKGGLWGRFKKLN
ncbi:cytochrome P450 6g1-like [Phymastichus coffea]|uniref:cytochrome P450 6g1-like n=1 Tax=Phymastichus coffea TaxID=108790 RepID=UPI00273CDBF6|nr:cytochrome P450 6g1-like [Phymastichus coffea]